MRKGVYNISEIYSTESKAQLSELAVMSLVAHMYYDLGMQQPEIAQKMFFSRSKVSRMITRARELGIVEIKVRRVTDRATNVEEKLKKLFSLQKAIVVTGFDGTPEDVLNTVTDYAAYYVSQLLKGSKTVGVTRGNTITKTVRKLEKTNDCELDAVQLMGSTSDMNSAAESRELVNRISNIYSGRSHYLNTPLYVDDMHVKQALMKDRVVDETFTLMQECDIVLTGIGGFGPDANNKNMFGYMTPKHMLELKLGGAEGSICARFFDANGAQVPCEWNRKCIAMPFELLNRGNLTVGVAAGAGKARAILGALRGGLLSTVITDIDTALCVIELQENKLNSKEKATNV